jgi:hypothetical protein
VPIRALLTRSAVALLVLVAAALAAIGGVSLGGAGLVVVALAAVVTGCLGAGIAHDGGSSQPRQAAVDAAWRTAVGTVAVLLVLSGCVALAGGGLALLLVGFAAGGALVRWALRSVRTRGRTAGGEGRGRAVVVPLAGADAGWVRRLSVEALGREWLRTSTALAQVHGPVAREALVNRRGEALDELERRDPAGFARWLAEGATVDSDPARYVSGDPTAGYDAA